MTTPKTETLTAEERNWPTPKVFGKALRIIDALTARVAEQRETIKQHCIAAHELSSERDAANARAEAADKNAQHCTECVVQAEATADAAESEAAALRAENERLKAESAANERRARAFQAGATKLQAERDAANELLGLVKTALTTEGKTRRWRIDQALTHLAGQPAAHTWGSAPGSVRPDCGHQQPAAGECAWCLVDAAPTDWVHGNRHPANAWSSLCPECARQLSLPGAPTRTEACTFNHPEDEYQRTSEELHERDLARTERPMLTREDWFAADDRRRAEQRVLDACARWFDEPKPFPPTPASHALYQAELARRGLK